MHAIGDLVLAYTVNNYIVFGIITECIPEHEIYFVSWFMNDDVLVQHYNSANIRALKQNLLERLECDKIKK